MATTTDMRKTMVDDPLDEYKKQQNNAYTQKVTDIKNTINQQTAVGQQKADDQLKQAEKKYRQQYDANAIQEVLDRNALNERMANRGLTNSGLNDTQQTAIALARGNRDASVTNSQNQFIADTNLALQEMYANAEADKANRILAAGQERDANILAAQQGFEQSYNDYLEQQAKAANDALKTENDFKSKWYTELIKGNITPEQYNIIVGGSTPGQTPTAGESQTVDPKTIPYSQRVYKKVEDPGDVSDFWGIGEDKFYDPVDNEVYTEDQLRNKLLAEGYTTGEADKIAQSLDNLDAGTFYTPGDVESGVEPKKAFAEYIIKYNLYGGNESLQKKALVDLGYTEKEAAEIVKEFSAG